MNKIMRITFDSLDKVCMIQRQDGSIRMYPFTNSRMDILTNAATKIKEGELYHFNAHLYYGRYREWHRYQEITPGFYTDRYGRLIVTVDPSDTESLDYCIDLADTKGWNAAELEYWGEVVCNSSLEYHPDASDSGIAMFSGPVFVERVLYPYGDPRYCVINDNFGTDWEASRVWYFDYAYESPLEALKRDGYVVFNGANDN